MRQDRKSIWFDKEQLRANSREFFFLRNHSITLPLRNEMVLH